MSIGDDELRALLRLVEQTRAKEIDCDEFLARVAGYVDGLRRSGHASASEEFLHHLRVCPECDEELAALLRAYDLQRP